jgi:Fur family ferric uptake transcriptional regulator
MNANSWLDQLQANGYRLTKARKAVVNVVAYTQCALNPQQVYEQARSACPGLGLVSVYRTLEKLEELSLIQRVHQPDGCNAYLPHADGHQHLIICEKCGKARYFDGDDMEAFFSKVGREHGFKVKEHWLQLFGVCVECED